MKPSVIFYGAGLEARSKFFDWIDAGIPIPVCFADADDNKQYTKFVINTPASESCRHLKFEILPLHEALEKYPDYLIFLSVSDANLLFVYNYLISCGVPKEKIKYSDHVEYRKGCQSLLTAFHVGPRNLKVCCISPYNTSIPRKAPMQVLYREYMETFGNLLQDIIENKPTHCDGCPYLVERFWPKNPKVNKIVFDTGFDSDSCNFNCIYCTYKNNIEGRYIGEKFIDVFRETLRCFEGVENIFIHLGVGEISVAHWKDEVLNLLKAKKWYSYIHTNASVYNSDIAEMIKEGYMTINVSLDSGTSRTFSKIKGVDCFDKVVENLLKYSECGHGVHLKYIILPEINTNPDDVDGFLDIAFKTFTEWGENVVVPVPSYTLYDYFVSMNGGKAYSVDLAEDFQLDVDACSYRKEK